jgi:hypothetical protein
MRLIPFALSVLAAAVVARRSYGPDWEQVYGGPGPSGSNNPVVSPNSTVAQELQQAFASGLLTPQQVQDICNLRLGVYSYYWAPVGDDVQKVRGRTGRRIV